MDENIRVRVTRLRNEARSRGETPTTVHLTKADEGAIATLGVEDLGAALEKRIKKDGVRNSLATFMGLRIIWDAPEFKMDIDK